MRQVPVTADSVKPPEDFTRVTPAIGIGYGIGMIGERLFRDAPALLLLIFMTNYLAIPAAAAGAAVFVPKLLLLFEIGRAHV